MSNENTNFVWAVFDSKDAAEEAALQAREVARGLRNPQGLMFDAESQLWSTEHGPHGGDELNLIRRGGNYGYPVVSNGDHYDGREIPDHDTRPEFATPAIWWTPTMHYAPCSPNQMEFPYAECYPTFPMNCQW